MPHIGFIYDASMDEGDLTTLPSWFANGVMTKQSHLKVHSLFLEFFINIIILESVDNYIILTL